MQVAEASSGTLPARTVSGGGPNLITSDTPMASWRTAANLVCRSECKRWRMKIKITRTKVIRYFFYIVRVIG
jgi:hypothetical protein